MTGLEPHPILTLPSREELAAMSVEEREAMREKRLKLLLAEQNDPYRNGWEAPIWHLIDDLLVEGKEVELVGRSYLEIPPEIANSKSPSLKIIGRRDLLIHGANGASKTEYAAKKIIKVLVENDLQRTWSYHETAPVSVARQQPLFWKYLPPEWKPAHGKLRQGFTANISYSIKNGFTENTFVLPNKSQHWFKNYAQEEQIVEGDQLNAAWLDELAPLTLVKTIRFRLVRRKGFLIVTFTPIKGWTPMVQEYNQGRRVIVEATADRLPIKDEEGKETGRYEKVPRIAVAGPGTDGNLKANVIFLHSQDNPFFDKEELAELLKGGRRSLILERFYGVATRAYANQFPKFNENVHVVRPDQIPRNGTRYQIVDPVAGRNWFILYMIVDPYPITLRDGSIKHRRWIYREWPSTGHTGISAYIPGIGDPGPWALPGNAADGERGPAQDAFGWGLERYKFEFERLEGVKVSPASEAEPGSPIPATMEKIAPRWRPKNPLKRSGLDAATDQPAGHGGEEIFERRMDSRYGATPTQDKASTTTLLEQMSDIGVEYLPASGKDIGEGVQLINSLLDYDDEVEVGKYSPKFSRINQPLLYVSSECPNLIYSLREWTGKDKEHGACKDPIDVLRYAVEDDLDYIGEETYNWAGGGTY